MNARLSLDEMRDALIAEKTAEHIVSIRAQVEAGDVPLDLIADGVSDLLCDSQLAHQITRLSLITPAAAGYVLRFLASHVIADQAEVEAIKEVEREEMSISSKDRLHIERGQRRAEISAAYTGYFPP